MPAPPNAAPKSKKNLIIIAAIVIAAIVIIAAVAVLGNKNSSPLASVKDTDSDGYPDAVDAFPNNPSEHVDSDLDGVGDNGDAFSTDSTQWADRDHDGYGDNPNGNNPDAFPDNAAEHVDSDNDGIGNNADIYDQGNGAVRIAITNYIGRGNMDPIINTNGDPKFLIKIDANQDGVYEFSRTSQTFNEASTLTNPYMVTMDVPDNLQHLRFAIEVYDVDTLGDDVIDYTPSASSTSYYCDTNAPFSESWSYNGADDSLSENDCQLSYAISVVAAT